MNSGSHRDGAPRTGALGGQFLSLLAVVLLVVPVASQCGSGCSTCLGSQCAVCSPPLSLLNN